MSFYPDSSLCPCGSGKDYSNCCQPVHQDHAKALRPEQLMRARYCAHALKLIDFVVATYHPSCAAENERDGIAESVDLDWIKLEVIDSPKPGDSEGFVEFKAYMDDDGVIQCMHERSRFLKENGLWYYIDGTFPEESHSEKDSLEENNAKEDNREENKTLKVGRNDPCPCGSGKKYKKCCG